MDKKQDAHHGAAPRIVARAIKSIICALTFKKEEQWQKFG